MQPATLRTGFVIAAVFALAAHFSALGNGLVWDDVALVASDVRIRDLSFVFGAFGDTFFGAEGSAEMYRPVVNASLAIDWFLSGSAPGDVNVVWFHVTNWLLHGVNAGLAYVFLSELTGRKLAAPLLAAVFFGVHPLAVEPVSWIAGRCDLLAAFFGLASGIFLLRTTRNKRLLVPALLCFFLSLCAKASFAMLPLLVGLAVMAYKDVPLPRMFGKRLFPRFALFVIPAAAWIGARVAVLGAPFPVAQGRRWSDFVGPGDALLGAGRAVFLDLGIVFLPARLCADYLEDPAFSPVSNSPGISAGVGLGLYACAFLLGVIYLRRARWAFPVLAFAIALVPVLQVVRIGAIVADRFLYFPALFLFLLVGEGLEYVHRRSGGVRAFGVAMMLFFLFTVQSHLRAPAFADDIALNRNVLESYPGARRANHRLAVALLGTGEAGDEHEARRRLNWAIDVLSNPNSELLTLGGHELEQGHFDDARHLLELALEKALDDGSRAKARYNLAVLEKHLGNEQSAIEHARAALGHAPRFELARRLLESLGVDPPAPSR